MVKATSPRHGWLKRMPASGERTLGGFGNGIRVVREPCSPRRRLQGRRRGRLACSPMFHVFSRYTIS